MTSWSKSGGSGLLWAVLLIVPGSLLADPAATSAAALPAATGPLALDEARRLASELSAGDAPAAADADLDLSLHADDLKLLPEAERPPADPLAAYQARAGKPSSGWRLNYDRYWEEVTFNWRVGF
ncbi:MAG: hypothetical protein D6727_10090 [Gammaproteobacteria bacterium]|nr:MAG: hypothetical protein D6727_10090 [Gammaproteobacteria bacterium]